MSIKKFTPWLTGLNINVGENRALKVKSLQDKIKGIQFFLFFFVCFWRKKMWFFFSFMSMFCIVFFLLGGNLIGWIKLCLLACLLDDPNMLYEVDYLITCTSCGRRSVTYIRSVLITQFVMILRNVTKSKRQKTESESMTLSSPCVLYSTSYGWTLHTHMDVCYNWGSLHVQPRSCLIFTCRFPVQEITQPRCIG